MSFVIIDHPAERIIEVIYPAEPSASEVADYTLRLKRLMDAQTSAWSCLVDQRASKMIAPKLMEKIGLLNAYAQRKGMLRSARVVASKVAMLQANRIAEEKGGLKGKLRTFLGRQEALAWLKSEAAKP
jgi:hypothetical protein